MKTEYDNNIMLQSAESDEEKLKDEWQSINWNSIEHSIFKIQKRIYEAEKNGEYRKVRDQSRLLTHSKRSLLYAIKLVTKKNKGRKTSGIDGIVINSDSERMALFEELSKCKIDLHNPKPVRRIYIPKRNNKKRPLGIPTIIDRVYQEVCKLALEPICEAKLGADSYGFRPSRGTGDAIAKIHASTRRLKRPYVFEGDFQSCFDTLNHQHILDKLGNFPLKNLIKKWLEAGYVENNVFKKTRTGTPQGGIISPLLANLALQGIEEALNVTYKRRKRNGEYCYTIDSKYVVIVYADDFVVLCKSLDDAKEVYSLLEDYLEERGLTLAPDKTKITSLYDGFDFLGYNIRCYKGQDHDKVLIKASKDSIKSFKRKAKDIISNCYPWNLDESIDRLNNLIYGTGMYWRIGSNKRLFSKMDNYIYELWMRQIKRWHPNKSTKWRVKKYFKDSQFPDSKDKWCFTDSNTNNQVIKMAKIRIKYHICLKYKATPYDDAFNDYYMKRSFKKPFEIVFKK